MILTIAFILIVLWILGLIGNIAGAFVNILLVVALAVIIYDFVARRSHRV